MGPIKGIGGVPEFDPGVDLQTNANLVNVFVLTKIIN